MTEPASYPPAQTSLWALLTRDRWVEIGRILLIGLITLLFWQEFVPLGVLIAGVAVGLYPLVKTGLVDLVRERKIGTEIFVTIVDHARQRDLDVLEPEDFEMLRGRGVKAMVEGKVVLVGNAALFRENGILAHTPEGEGRGTAVLHLGPDVHAFLNSVKLLRIRIEAA